MNPPESEETKIIHERVSSNANEKPKVINIEYNQNTPIDNKRKSNFSFCQCQIDNKKNYMFDLINENTYNFQIINESQFSELSCPICHKKKYVKELIKIYSTKEIESALQFIYDTLHKKKTNDIRYTQNKSEKEKYGYPKECPQTNMAKVYQQPKQISYNEQSSMKSNEKQSKLINEVNKDRKNIDKVQINQYDPTYFKNDKEDKNIELIKIHCKSQLINKDKFINSFIIHNQTNSRICKLFDFRKFECPECYGIIFKEDLLTFISESSLNDIIRSITQAKINQKLDQNNAKLQTSTKIKAEESYTNKDNLLQVNKLSQKDLKQEKKDIQNEDEEQINVLFPCENKEIEINECLLRIVNENIKNPSIVKDTLFTKFICPTGLHEISKYEVVYAFGCEKANEIISMIINQSDLNKLDGRKSVKEPSKIIHDNTPLKINCVGRESSWHCLKDFILKEDLISKIIEENKVKFRLAKSECEIIFLCCPFCKKELLLSYLKDHLTESEIKEIKKKIINEEKQPMLKVF